MNKWIASGRLTKDPDLNFTPGSGTAVAKFTLAVTRPFKKDETDFINCVAFGKTAETIATYFKKGKEILIDAQIQVSKYQKDGENRYSTTAVINSFEFLGKKGESKQSTENIDLEPIGDVDMPF